MEYNRRNREVVSHVKFVPLSSREIITDENGNQVRRGGVDYVFIDRNGNRTTSQRPDFIQGTKESAVRSARLAHYPSAQDAVNGTNLQYGTLGDSNGNEIAQGKHHIKGNLERVISGMIFRYPDPMLQESYSTASYAVTTQHLNAGAIADYLIANPTYSADIDAHTDRVDSDENNMTLSQERANGVMDAIIQSATNSGKYTDNQISDLRSRLNATGHGESAAAGRGAADDEPNASDRTTIISINRP